MAEQEQGIPRGLLFVDPLTRGTRRVRQQLLGACAIGLAIGVTGLVPSRISALGVEFSPSDRRAMLFMLAAVIVYLLLAFVIYAWLDWAVWKTGLSVARARTERKRSRYEYEPHDEALDKLPIEFHRRMWAVSAKYPMPKATVPLQWARLAFDIILPPVVAVTTIAVLLTRTPPEPPPN